VAQLSPTGWAWLVLAFPLAGTLVISLGWRVLSGRLAGWIGTGAILAAFLASIGALVTLQDRPHGSAPSPRARSSTSRPRA